MNIPFGITFKLKGGKLEDYKYREIAHFVEVADSIYPEALREEYIKFLDSLMGGEIRKTTLVDLELVKLFQGDLDNRAQIDYREGHWDDDEEIFSGGEYFDRVAKQLESHINETLNMNIYEVKTTLFTHAKATELVDYYNKLNNSAGWFYEIVDGNVRQRAYCQHYIRITSPKIEQFDGSNIVGYF